MMNLYDTPQLYDVFYNEAKEEPLKNHYESILKDTEIKSIFDCSIGTGNLTYVLSDLGYVISGSDISPEMLEVAQEKSNDRKIEVKLYEADFRNINKIIDHKYDCVMSTGNSLPHVNNDDVKTTLKAMTGLLNSGGYLYLDIRNWDKIINEKERFAIYNPLIRKDDRVNVTLLKDYYETHIDFNFLYTFEKENKIYKNEHRHVKYYPIKKEMIIETLERLGYEDIKVYNFINHKVTEFKDMQWYALIGKLKV